MAKKVVATLRTTSGKDYAKVIRMARSPKSGAYVFKETIVANELVKDFLAKK
ncbi:MAG: DUF4295 domain-containing protein [Bacteroidales bacterium]|jgi:hypothetical protein|nr:DUF4295 domain-containing protein [Bacteroidales bacterium]